MKISGIFRITGRGDALTTDERFKPRYWAIIKDRKKLRVSGVSSVIELEIIGVEALLKSSREEFLSFVVAPIEDEAVRAAIVGQEAELI